MRRRIQIARQPFRAQAPEPSLEPQSLVNGALGFLPAWQLLDIRHPALEARMIVQRQALRFVRVHRRRNGNVGDRHGVASEPFRRRQPRVEDAGEPMPVVLSFPGA